MSEIKHTPGPLFVRQPEKWPFNIEIVDAAGEMVFEERRYCYGSGQESIEDVMNCRGFRNTREDPHFVDRCIELNERQLADAHLRAAAPELLEALDRLQSAVDRYFGPSQAGAAWPKFFDPEMHAARAAIDKARSQT